MAYEFKEPLILNDRTVKKPRYQIDDTGEMVEASFKLINVKTGETVLTGATDTDNGVVIDNEDVDAAGRLVNTITPVLDIRGTGIEPGFYLLSVRYEMDSGEGDVISQPVEIVDYEVA